MGKLIHVPDEIFGEFYNRYFDMVYRVCYLYMKNELDTQAMVQSTFTKYFKSKVVFLNEEHAKVWFITTSASLCSEVLKPWRHSAYQYAAYNSTLCYNSAEELLLGIKGTSSLKRIADENTSDAGLLSNEDNKLMQLLLSRIFRLPVKYIVAAYLYYEEGYSTEEIGRCLSRREDYIKRIIKRCDLILQNYSRNQIKMERDQVKKALEEIKPSDGIKEKIVVNIYTGNNFLEKQNFYQIYKYYIFCRIIVAVSICLIIIVGSMVMWKEKDKFYILDTSTEIIEGKWAEAGNFSFSFSLQGNNIDRVVFASESQYLVDLSNNKKGKFVQISATQLPLTVDMNKEKKIIIEWIPTNYIDELGQNSPSRSFLPKNITDIILYRIKKEDQSIFQGGIEVKMLSNGQIFTKLLSFPNNEFNLTSK